MDFVIDVITNYPLMSAAAGWIIAQLLKTTTGIFKVKKFSLIELFCGTGGMPSSHAASVSALACACALKEGVASHAFAISIVFALIVMRDAMGMRRQIGEHAKALNMIIVQFFSAKNDSESTEKMFTELAGHTPLQVFVGSFVGVIVAFLMALIPAFNVPLFA